MDCLHCVYIIFVTVWTLLVLVCRNTKRRLTKVFKRMSFCGCCPCLGKKDSGNMQHQVDANQETEPLLCSHAQQYTKQIEQLQEALKTKDNEIARLRSVDIAVRSRGRFQIANESDSRMQLSDAFDTLFDNEWTNVMRAKFGTEELAGIRFLSGILQECNQYCQDVAKEQLVQFVFPRQSLGKEIHIHEIFEPGELRELFKIRMAISHHDDVKDALFKTFWVTKCKEEQFRNVLEDTIDNKKSDALVKSNGKSSVEPVRDDVKSKNEKMEITSRRIPQLGEIEAYVKKCIDLCWQFAILDPPVLLLFDAVGKNFNDISENFKKYDYVGPLDKNETIDTVMLVVRPAVISKRADEKRGRLIGDCKGKVIVYDSSSVDHI